MSIDRRLAIALLAAAALIAPLASAQALLDDLVIAVANDRASEVQKLLARGLDPNSVGGDGESLLYTAARNGSLATVDVLLAAKARVDAGNRVGDTPMMVAALQGYLPIVRKLREAGAALDPRGWTPLAYAATGGHDAIVAYLLDQGAAIDARSPNGTTPLMMAIREHKLSTAELLLARGANASLKNENGASALSWALRGNEQELAQRLRRAGATE
jgi:ankyrin repeat protein